MKRKSLTRFTKIIAGCLALLLGPVRGQGAPCCAGGSSLPGLITSDDKFLIGTAVTMETSDWQARTDGSRFRKSTSDGGETLALRVSGVFSDDWQAGFEFPMVRRHQALQSGEIASTGVGDITLMGAYELVSDLTYSAYRPKVYLFSRLQLPTGRSMYEISNLGSDVAIGKGFTEWGVGALAIKTWGRWDVSLTAQGNWILPRSFTVSTDTTDYDSTLSWGGGMAVGYLFRAVPLRVAGAVNYLATNGRFVTTAGTTNLSDDRGVWDTMLTFGYRFSDEWSGNLILDDQTILPAENVDLSRSVSISFQRNFPL